MPHSTPQPSALKVCSKCGASKPLIQYSIYSTGTYKTHCKECAAAYARQRRLENPDRARELKNKSYARNRERRQAEISARLMSDPQYRSKRNERKRRWYEKNREYVARKRAEYYAAHGDIARKYSQQARLLQPDKYKARYLVAHTVRSDKFPPAFAMVCELCQEAQAAHWHHHRGYAEEYRLDVIAVCLACHGQEHRVDSL